MKHSSSEKKDKRNLQTYVTPSIFDKVEIVSRKEGLDSSEWLKRLVMDTLNEKEEHSTRLQKKS
jgi:hypothetical protein